MRSIFHGICGDAFVNREPAEKKNNAYAYCRHQHSDMRDEVLTAVPPKIRVFWRVTLLLMLGDYYTGCFG
jgi:hypothetical protein